MNALDTTPFHQLSSEAIVRSLMEINLDPRLQEHRSSLGFAHAPNSSLDHLKPRSLNHLKLARLQLKLVTLLLTLAANRNKNVAITTACKLGALSLEFAQKRFELEHNIQLTRKCQKLVQRNHFKPTSSVAAVTRTIVKTHAKLADILATGGTASLATASQDIRHAAARLKKTGNRRFERWTGHYRSSSKDLVSYFSKIQDLLTRG